MPIYEYVCKNCKNKFELMRSFSKSNEGAACPMCQKDAQRIISSCYSMSSSQGESKPLAGSGHSCGSCSSGSCSTCGH